VPVFGHYFFFKDFIDGCQMFYVKSGVPVGAEQRHDQRFDGGMGSPKCVRRHAGVNDINSGFNRLEMGHG